MEQLGIFNYNMHIGVSEYFSKASSVEFNREPPTAIIDDIIAFAIGPE